MDFSEARQRLISEYESRGCEIHEDRALFDQGESGFAITVGGKRLEVFPEDIREYGAYLVLLCRIGI